MKTYKHFPDVCTRKRLAVAILGLIALGAAPLVRAENLIRMGYGEGAAGERGVEVIVTATNDKPIHGYSLAFTYPPEALSLRSISTSGTNVQVVDPDFVAPKLDNQFGVGGLGVIFSFTEPIELKVLEPLSAGAYPRIVARLTFDVHPDAPGGTYPLQLVDGIGQPASFNRFSERGTSIRPDLEHGSFRVFGGNVLALTKEIVFGGIKITRDLFALAAHPEPLAGFQIGFTYDNEALLLKNATYSGTSLGVALGGAANKIEAWTFDTVEDFAPGLARTAVASLFDFSPPFDGQVLAASTADPPTQSLVKFTFEVAETAETKGTYLDLHLSDTSIPGDIDNRFIVEDRSLDPTLVDGKIYFSLGSFKGRVIDSVSLQPIANVKIETEPDGHTTTTGADGRFTIRDVPPGEYMIFLSRAGYYSARQDQVAGSDAPIIASGLEGVVDDVGDIPLYAVPPATGSDDFLRGYTNGDNKVDLSDGVYLLLYLFRGGDAPTCLLAADTNDDNKVDISDSVYMLNYLFLGGTPPPPPFSQQGIDCGADPTPGALSCAEFTCP